jgi:ubiquinone/menaquinone biosynthesis C-methylase UbiE
MPLARLGVVIITLALAVVSSALASAQQAEPAKAREKDKGKAKAPRRARSDPPGFYMGRQIADVMSFAGADWLVRETREQEEQPERMLDALKIPKGATVADVGAGVGYTSVRLARRVGPGGTVYATDLQPEMLRMLRENARAVGVSNIKPVLCTTRDTKLPDAAIDLVVMVDVYHECSDPEATLRGLRKALKPGGRLVLVEFRAEDPDVPIKPEHKMTLGQARREVEPQGFTFRESVETLPWQHIIIFEKPRDPDSKPESKPASTP